MANTRTMNELEELGRIDSEKAYTIIGKRNLKAEKSRVVREIKHSNRIVKHKA
tara:strand:- start:1153 stop:1311 length:159 start_codon:yes stop_codon:yes gene_type:complete